MPFATAHTVSLEGATGHLIDVQVDVGPGVAGTYLVGRPDTSISESRDRCRAAVINCDLDWPVTKRVTVLLSPADLPKRGPHFDLSKVIIGHTWTMRASIYCRISKDRAGAGLGVGSQEQDCRELATTLGATIVSVHTDNDLSAYSGKPRPGYRSLVREVEQGVIDAVLVWHTDRLHRSPSELEQYISACQKTSVKTLTVQAGPIDLATPAGQLVARQLGAVARYEVDHAIERMQRAKLRSAEAGTWKGGRRPFGYESDGVTIRESEATLIRQATDRILAGDSVRSVARDWIGLGVTTTAGKPWSLHGPRRVLLRPRNAGLMEHRGEIIGEAAWPAIVEPEKWRSLVRVLTNDDRRTNLGSSARKWLGSGIYRCGVCDGPLRASLRDREKVYRCEQSHVTRGLHDLNAYIEGVVQERLRRDDARDLLRIPEAEFDVRAAEGRAIELRERLDQLSGMFAAGEIDAQQLTTGTKALNADLETIREKITTAYAGTVFAEVGSAPDPAQAWLDAPLDRRRAILDALLKVRVNKSPNGRPAGWRPGESYFRPETVDIEWRRGA